MELGWSLAQETSLDIRVRRQQVPGLLVRVGVLERLEARLGFEGWMRSDTRPSAGPASQRSGVGDIDAGFKVGLMEAVEVRPTVALIGTVKIPSGDEGFARRRADPALVLAFQNQLSPAAGVGYNIGAEWTTDCDPDVADACRHRTVLHVPYTLALGFALGGPLAAYLEVFGALGLDAPGPARHAVDGGLTFLVRQNLQLDVSAGAGLDADAEDWFVGAGVAMRLPR